jgi:hypothetical protein
LKKEVSTEEQEDGQEYSGKSISCSCEVSAVQQRVPLENGLLMKEGFENRKLLRL